MSCESVRQLLLDLDLDSVGRSRLQESLKHVEECPACQSALADFDAMRQAVSLPAAEADVEPPVDWMPANRDSHRQFRQSPAQSPVRMRFLALAASILVLVASFMFGRFFANQEGPTPPLAVIHSQTPDEESRFTPADLGNQLNAFHQVSQFFDGRAGWMMVSDKNSDVGVTDGRVDAAGKVLLLHLTVQRDGNEISSTDLLVIPGQGAKLNIPFVGDQVLHYRVATSADEPTHLTLTLEMRSPGGTEPLAAISTNLRLQPGQRVTAGELCSYSGRYVLKVGFARASLIGSTSQQ